MQGGGGLGLVVLHSWGTFFGAKQSTTPTRERGESIRTKPSPVCKVLGPFTLSGCGEVEIAGVKCGIVPCVLSGRAPFWLGGRGVLLLASASGDVSAT